MALTSRLFLHVLSANCNIFEQISLSVKRKTESTSCMLLLFY